MVVLIPLSFFDSAKVANFIELCKYFVRFPLKTLQKGHFLRVVITVSTILGKVCLYTLHSSTHRLHAITQSRNHILEIEHSVRCVALLQKSFSERHKKSV